MSSLAFWGHAAQSWTLDRTDMEALWVSVFCLVSIPLSFPHKSIRNWCHNLPAPCSWLCIFPETYENIPVFDNANIIIVATYLSISENGSSSLVREEKSPSTDSSSVSWPLPARNTQLLVITREPGPLICQMMDRSLVLYRNCETEFRSWITSAKCSFSLGKWGQYCYFLLSF